MVLKANDRRTSCPCHDEFRGPRSDYVRQSIFEYLTYSLNFSVEIPGSQFVKSLHNDALLINVSCQTRPSLLGLDVACPPPKSKVVGSIPAGVDKFSGC
ncbi:hypothetical protein TNCV_1669271 [Trichonephila clavipes]|nr:hypothetical protein TNCV_1669271 [Trichonephila clavipes]